MGHKASKQSVAKERPLEGWGISKGMRTFAEGMNGGRRSGTSDWGKRDYACRGFGVNFVATTILGNSNLLQVPRCAQTLPR